MQYSRLLRRAQHLDWTGKQDPPELLSRPTWIRIVMSERVWVGGGQKGGNNIDVEAFQQATSITRSQSLAVWVST